ncbi:MAG: hypothetical protein RSA68_06690, partial [Hafnia sp.]
MKISGAFIRAVKVFVRPLANMTYETAGVGVRREVASAQPLDSRAFYRAVCPTGLGAHVLCALNLPPASLLAALKCVL